MRAARGRSRMPDYELRQLVETIRSKHDISEIVQRWTPLHRAGRELVGLCLNHKESNPSMRVSNAKGVVYCFSCGYTADIIQVVRDQMNCGFMAAIRWIDSAELQIVDEEARRRAEAEAEAERARDIASAREFWEQGVDPTGTPAAVYLRDVRGIRMPLPPSIRFGMVPPWRDRITGEWAKPAPAVLCAVYNKSGDIVGIQRIFLRNGGRAKARMKRPKLTLGRIRGASLRLGPPQPTIIICEGAEDGLSLAQEIPGSSVWPTLGTGLMPAVQYPEIVTEIVIAGQNDEAGAEATERAAQSLLEQGFAVRTMFPDPAFKDWNDELRGVRR